MSSSILSIESIESIESILSEKVGQKNLSGEPGRASPDEFGDTHL